MTNEPNNTHTLHFRSLTYIWHGSYTPGPTLWKETIEVASTPQTRLAPTTHTYIQIHDALSTQFFYFFPVNLELRTKGGRTGQSQGVLDPHVGQKPWGRDWSTATLNATFGPGLLQPPLLQRRLLLLLLLVVDLVRTKYLVSLKGPTSYNSFWANLFPILPNPGPGPKRKWQEGAWVPWPMWPRSFIRF